MGSPESYSGGWDIQFIPPLLDGPISSQPPLSGWFSPVYTWGRRGLCSGRGSQLGHWRLDGVRIWKLSRTYPGEKPPSLSVLTHGSSLATGKPTRRLPAIPCLLVRKEPLTTVDDPLRSTCPGTMAPSLTQDF